MQSAGIPDDLHSILNRFSSWSGAQPGKAAAAAGSRRGMGEGVREIPYEEALRQLRRHRAAEPCGTTAGAAANESAKRPGEGAEAACTPQADAPATPSDRRKTRKGRKAAGAGTAARASRGRRTAAPAQKEPGPSAKTARTEFRQVLTKTLSRPSGDGFGGGSGGAERELRISVRVSREEEQELHRRAAAGGMTISAYLRRCALGIGEEPAQEPAARSVSRRVPFAELDQEEAESLSESPAEEQAEPAAGAGGWLSRLRQRFRASPAFEESA